jgi:hypothetical protein
MKPELSQVELARIDGQIVIAYRTAFEVCNSHGAECWILRPIKRKVSGMPYTKRGRFFAVSPEAFDKLERGAA